MEKILKKYTTIPEHLYVTRNADEQLKRIVNEMQRPGYVLVARQMGKTNLLFNAKRTLENKNRLFVYVDLSNVFKYELDCYRNIIDSIIEPNEELFETIESKIIEVRSKNIPAHKEYSRSLRIILDFFDGDIVIVLDEIDALRSAEYSDNIFAQIRSNYFSRTNFPVFERLTYILSGVIEPTELIKDRNKSPFNIGDKIYLDDFTFNEHKSFLEKSKLDLSDEISENIFEWTNGNPRLTFDICSEIEDILMLEKGIDTLRIKKLINDKYLKTFDIAPIDHIRELVKSNKKVRNAILKIHQNKSTELSDEIKRKLYLYGIINSDYSKEISIKNRIVTKCISKEWINSIDKQSQDNFSYGLDKMDQFDFDEAIISLIEFMSNSNPTKEQEEICNYNIGFAYYKKKNINKAIEYFSHNYSILSMYKNNAKSLLGVCKLSIGENEQGVEILESVIITKSDDFAYRNALLNLAQFIEEKEKDRALKLYDDLLISTFNSKDSTKEIELDKLKTLASYYKANIYHDKNQNDKTIDALNYALKYSNLSDSLYIKYSIYNISKEKNETIKGEIASAIIEHEIKFNNIEQYPISFNENHLFYYLDLIFEKENNKKFYLLLEYAESELYNNKYNKYQIALWSSRISNKGTDILVNILENISGIPEQDKLNIYRELSSKFTEDIKMFFNYFNKFLLLFKSHNEVISNDIYLFAIAIKHYSDQSKLDLGIELCETIESKFSFIENEILEFEFLIIYYWHSNLFFSQRKRIEAIDYANKTINLIESSERKKTSLIDEKGMKAIISQMKQIKVSTYNNRPIVKPKKYGRNDRIKVKYKTGEIVENKYKKLEADILSERCVII